MKLITTLIKKFDASQFAKFIVTGILSTIINFLIYFFSVNTIGFGTEFAALSGYIIGLLCSYLLGKKWVFSFNEINSLQTATRFIIVYLMGLVLHTFITSYLALTVDYRIAWTIGISASTANNFFGSKYYAFRNH